MGIDNISACRAGITESLTDDPELLSALDEMILSLFKTMDKQDILDRFSACVYPSHPNEWEVEEFLDGLAVLPDESCRELLTHVSAIWPVSHSLCYGYLKYGAGQVSIIPLELLPEWVRQLLFHYEKGGLRQAEAFMADASSNFLSRTRKNSEVSLSEVRTSLTHYIRGLSGYSLSIADDSRVWTDSETIYLPPVLDMFSSREENRLLYKFLLTYQAILASRGFLKTFVDLGGSGSVPDTIVGSEQDVGLLKLFLFIKGTDYLRVHLPGLWSRSFHLIRSQMIIDGNEGAYRILEECWDRSTDDVREAMADDFCQQIPGEYHSFRHMYQAAEIFPMTRFQKYIIGSLNFARTAAVLEGRRENDKKSFVKMVARVILDGKMISGQDDGNDKSGNSGTSEADAAVAVIAETLERAVRQEKQRIRKFNNTDTIVPDELLTLAQSIYDDRGAIPTGYYQAASGLASGGITGDNAGAGECEVVIPGGTSGYVYDEWDCRRSGYRSEWCTVFDEELQTVKSDFIPRVLSRYSGFRKKLRAQFEMLRTSRRFVRRQRDGDDLDLDAITDAMGDRRAGKYAGERLFVRLQRDDRSITTIFLIDMSNSTSGWISRFIKESLVLLCEAMEIVGDQYGIYGFSGMKRSGCKLYHIKTLEEPYDQSTKDRISAIGPKDYTRMAPAVRHLTTILEKADTRSRLLITLSDGKPEDYDGYTGQYAIEDTRKALLEARGRGIKPFCITVDKQSHDYLDHMFGAGNYIFINRIESLPAKMSQVYRVLTR